MSEDLHSDYIITPEIYEKHMKHYYATYSSTVEDFKGRLSGVVKKASTEGGICWGSLLETTAKAYPNRIAVKWDDSDRPMPYGSEPVLIKSIRYKDFNELVNRYANYFISKGLEKNDVVCLLIENRMELLAIYCAVSKTGATSSLINIGWKDKTLTHAFNILPAKFLIIGEEFLDTFLEIKDNIHQIDDQKLFCLEDLGRKSIPDGFIHLNEAINDSSIENPTTTKTIAFSDINHWVFTSGTTGGMPKAAKIAQKQVIEAAHAFQIVMDMQANDTIYIPLPFFHQTALVAGWPPAMLVGAALAIRRKFSVSRFWDDIRKFNATKFCYIGELCRYLLNQPENKYDTANSLTGMIGNGLRPEIWKEFKARFDVHRVTEFYGAGELPSALMNIYNFNCTVGFSFRKNTIVKYNVDNEEPIRGDDGFMIEVDPGEAGLLIFEISEKTPLPGYTNKAETEKKILRDVFQKGDAWFNTGDLLRDVGFNHCQFVDRLGDTFRWHGENVSTTEVEKSITNSGLVTLACSYGVKIPDTDGRAGMAAVIPKHPDIEFDFKTLIKTLKKELADYAIPKFIRIVKELEQTPTMKVLKNPLKKEGFNLEVIEDHLYVLLPGESDYKVLTEEIYSNIQEGKYRF